jgi:GNAT superfamily N-acetyltransferase
MNIRPRTKTDFPQVAQLITLCDPQWPVTAEKLEAWESQRNPKYFHADYVAEQDGSIVAVGGFHEDSYAYEEGKYWIGVDVHPHHRRLGIGANFYRFLLDQLSPRQPIKLVAGADQDKTESLRFLHKHGYVEEWRRYNSRWNPEGFDFEPYEGLGQTLLKSGLVIKNLSELPGEETLRQLWELDWVLFQDVPMGLEFTKRDFEQWKKDELESPEFVPEGVLIALDPQRGHPLTGPMVGYTQLSRNKEAGFWVINMTGVLREYRGRKVAQSLKLRGMKLVAAIGGEIRTTNDPPNKVMYEMNLKLGFKPYPSWSRYQKRLDGKPVEPFDESRYQKVAT